MSRGDLMQGMRFGLVGAGGYVVNMSVSAFALDALRLHYLVAATLAFCVALTHNFVLNRIWTFGIRDAAIPEQALRFTLVALASLALGLALLEGFVTLGLDELASQAISVALVAPVNFALNRTWTFSAELEALR